MKDKIIINRPKFRNNLPNVPNIPISPQIAGWDMRYFKNDN